MAGTELTPKQRKAIAALLEFGEIKAAAEAAGVSRPSLYAWMKKPEFQAALRTGEEEALREVSRRLVALGSNAAHVVEKTMNDPKVSASTRLRAADTVLARLLQLKELTDIEMRLRAIEERNGTIHEQIEKSTRTN